MSNFFVLPGSRGLVGLGPVFPGVHVDLQGNLQLGPDVLHGLLDQMPDRFQFVGGHLEDQFVVNREQHGGPKTLFPEGVVDADHGQLDQIRGRSLDRRVDRGSLGKASFRASPSRMPVYRFLAPVRIGDTITARAEVTAKVEEKNKIALKTTCSNQDGTVVLDGEAVVSPPKA
jgi:hypothetical protein